MRAIGLHLEERDCFQVSTNVHDYRVTPLRAVVEAVRCAGRGGGGGAGGPGARGGVPALPRGPADPRLLARAAPARERVTLNHADGPDEEQAQAQAPRHAGRDDRAAGRTGSSRTKTDAKQIAKRTPRGAPQPRADLARLGEPGRHRRGRVRGAAAVPVRERPGAQRLPGRRSCSSSTSRSATSPTGRSTTSASAGRSNLQPHGRPHVHRRNGAGELLPVPPRRVRLGADRRPGRRGREAARRRSTSSA